MFRVKICGITNPHDARVAVRAGADAIGLNFYPGSRRSVNLRQAAEIIDAIEQPVAKVGVFVNATGPEIRQAVVSLGLDFVQLHGDEPPETIVELDGVPVIRAFRLSNSGWQPLVDHLEQCQHLDALPTAVLVDAFRADAYGGTGESPDWVVARRYHDLGLKLPLILAGGLTPAIVSQAITAVGPFAVDTASGVESAPGIKDDRQVAAFIAAAREALLSS
jgi:phosphoribosylanthranilate isomerase